MPSKTIVTGLTAPSEARPLRPGANPSLEPFVVTRNEEPVERLIAMVIPVRNGPNAVLFTDSAGHRTWSDEDHLCRRYTRVTDHAPVTVTMTVMS